MEQAYDQLSIDIYPHHSSSHHTYYFRSEKCRWKPKLICRLARRSLCLQACSSITNLFRPNLARLSGESSQLVSDRRVADLHRASTINPTTEKAICEVHHGKPFMNLRIDGTPSQTHQQLAQGTWMLLSRPPGRLSASLGAPKSHRLSERASSTS